MLTKLWGAMVCWLLLSLLVTQPLHSFAQTPPQTTADNLCAEVRRIGTGSEAHIEVTLTTNEKLKGFIIEIRQHEFEVAQEKSGRVATIAYDEVARIRHLKKRTLPGAAKAAILIGLAAFIIGIGIYGASQAK